MNPIRTLFTQVVSHYEVDTHIGTVKVVPGWRGDDPGWFPQWPIERCDWLEDIEWACEDIEDGLSCAMKVQEMLKAREIFGPK